MIKNSVNDSEPNTHASGRILTWVQGKMLHYFSSHGVTTPSRLGPLHHTGFMITLGHITLGRLPWTSYRPDAETPT